MEAELTGAAVVGIKNLFEWGGIVTVLLLDLLLAVFFGYYLLRRNQTMADASITAQLDVAKAITTLTEVIRAKD